MNETDRSAWLADRRRSIGGSDAPSILGLTSWGSPLKVWESKRALVPDMPDNERLAMGRALEPLIAQRFMEDSGMVVVTDPAQIQSILEDGPADLAFARYGDQLLARNSQFPFLHATPDGLCWRTDVPERIFTWEAKTVEVWHKDEWAEGPPEHVRVQTLQNDLVLGTDGGVVAAWIGLAERFLWADIGAFEYDEALAHIEAMADFMTLVENATEPTATAADKIERPEMDEPATAPMPDDLIEWDHNYPDHAAEAKARKALIDEFKAKLKQRMKQLEVYQFTLPNGDSWRWGKSGLRRVENKNA